MSQATDPTPVKKREIFGWCCFDFANSSFVTIIVTVIYPIYFAGVVAAGNQMAPALWGTALSLSQLAVLLVSPLIGAMADIRANKKTWLAGTAGLCAISTAALFFVGPGEIGLALGLVMVGTMAFYLSENVCAGFLPEISTPENAGRISGYGWSFGYLGGLLSLVFALVMIEAFKWPVPTVFVMTAGFFALAAMPTLLLLRERARPRPLPPGAGLWKASWGENLRSLRELKDQRTLGMFFISLFFSTAGLTAVVAFASMFAGQELKLGQKEIISLFVVLQLAGVAGAAGFGFLQDKAGPKLAISLALLLWVVVCVGGYLCHTRWLFYTIGVGAGVAMGALQSGGRAVVALFTPPGRSGEYFGYWGFFSKLAGVVGQPMFGVMAALCGFREAILANAGFFVIGLLILLPLSLAPGEKKTELA